MIREPVRQFVQLGPLPAELGEAATVERLEALDAALRRIDRPVTDEEAKLLLGAFGPDSCYGIAWSLLHLIETAPHCPVEEPPADDANEWVRSIWRGVQNARLHGIDLGSYDERIP